MRCVFPTCNFDTKRGFLQGITLHRFPEEESLRTAWLEALGMAAWHLEVDSTICSKHFLTEDFLVTRRGKKLRSDAVPIDNVQVCRICFARDCKLYAIKDDMQLDLSRPSYALAYETLTGLLIEEDDKLPPYLCIQCANLLLNCVRFRAKCLQAHTVLAEIVNDYGYITMDSIMSVNTVSNTLSSHIRHIQSDRDHTKSESTYTTLQNIKDEDIMMDGIKTESDNVFEQNILITDVRSTSDHRLSPNLQDDFSGCYDEAENVNTMNKQSLTNEVATNTDIACLPNSHEDTADGQVETENNGVVDNDNVDNESDNYCIRDLFEDENCSKNESLTSEKTREKDKLSPTKLKVLGKKDSNQTIANQNCKLRGNGGLLLSYKRLSCEICKYQTVSEVQLRHHLRTHSALKLYNCHKCYFLTNSKQSLQFHYAIHSEEKSYSCDICHKTFSYKTDVKTHLRVHTGEKPYSCDVCSKNFRQRNQLTAHLRIHSGEKPYLCNVCNKAFRQKGQLLGHLVKHSGKKPYTCDVCNKKFAQRGQLQGHLLIHSGEKPYSCDVCNKAFVQRGQLQSHLRIHTGEKPYSCDVCSKAFVQRGQLQNHLQIHTR